MQPTNRYKADLRDFKFLLFEQFRLDELLGKAPFEDWGREEVEAVLEEIYKWTCEVLGPLNAVGDQQGCRIEDGKVKTPTGFKDAWKKLFDAGWRTLSVAEKWGGQAGPFTLHMLAEEMMCGGNVAFNMYPGLSQGVADVIEHFGTDAQKEYCHKLFNGVWGGTMCLTEPHAGSDVGANTTKAIRQGDGKYKIEGTKIFISGGDHDLTENILHLVLARTEDAPAGTKGLSLFIVPRDRFDGSGNNDVKVGGIEHKMGINGSSTCVLNFGEDGECVGELVGTEEQQGIKQMFKMMNFARIGVGVQGLAVASAAYLSALDYAKERKQGSSIANWKDPEAPKVAIIEHPDVRRMLLDMKARVEGIRALAVKLTMHTDKERILREQGKADEANYHKGQVDLLVPLLKAYGSDQAFLICATAIQTFGGAGYLKDHPVEQYCRDSKIFSIYEGTNHIQALDLVGRKLGYRGGVNFQAFAGEVGKFVAANREHEVLGDAVATLGSSMEALTSGAMRFLQWFQGGKMEMVPLAANRFLEMMSETTVGWLLLEGAVLAHEASAKLADGHPDKAFYAGKVAAATFFAHNVLPSVVHKAAILGKEDRSALEIPDDAFASV